MIHSDDPAAADILLLGAGYDATSSFGKGADCGPRALVEMLNTQIEFLERETQTNPAESLSMAYHALAGLADCAPDQMVDRVAAAYAAYPAPFKILLGGEHSVTNGPLKHFAAQAAEITVVQIDAHADLRMDDSDYNETPFGRYAHSAVMRRALELGYHLVQVGLRAFSEEEQQLFAHERVTAIERRRAEIAVEDVLRCINTDKVYLTIDLDGFDPSVMPATGTPVPGGLGWYEGVDIARGVIKNHTLVGFDIVELACRSVDASTEYNAAQLCYSLIAELFCRRR
jgi:agmatinase